MTRKPLGASYWKELAGRQERRDISEQLRSFLVCPDDEAPLEFRGSEGGFLCPGCQRVYTQTDGILEILPDGDPYQLSQAQCDALAQEAAAVQTGNEPEALFGALWDTALNAAGDLRGKRILDLCSGSGWAAARFAQRGADVCAVDIVRGPGGLATAAKHPVSIDLIRADAVGLPFAGETFHLIFIARTLHRIPRPERIMREVGRVLKEDGIVLSLGEPLGTEHHAGIARTDPRQEGHALSLADYQGIFQEGGLRMIPLFPGDSPNGFAKRGISQRIRQYFRHHRSAEPRLFFAKHEQALRTEIKLPRFLKREANNSE